MRTSTVARLLAALAMIGASAGIAFAGLSGTVTAISAHEITMGNAVYAIGSGTSIEDLSGQKVALREIRPGTLVELEFDEAGSLAIIRATLVR